MALRMVEIALPSERAEEVEALIKGDESVQRFWHDTADEGRCLFKALMEAKHAEPLMDELERRFAEAGLFRLAVLPVEATLPRLEEKPAEDGAKTAARVSREELYADIAESARFTRIFAAMTVLSAVVAAMGLTRDNTAVVIGAMVIAPLLGPNVGLALATALGDVALGRRALQTNVSGVALALAVSLGLGMLLSIDPATPELASRTEIHFADIALALASGVAGVLAFTSGASSALVGVMVAVALMPPLVTVGLLIGAGHFEPAAGAAMLLAANVISVNLAGVATFLVQGVRPRVWFEAEKAKRAVRYAIVAWALLLGLLALMIYTSAN